MCRTLGSPVSMKSQSYPTGFQPSRPFQHSPYYFMFATLTNEEGTREIHILSDFHTHIIRGSVVSSIYHAKDTDNVEGAFFVFPDISVRVEGTYRLKFSLFEIVGSVVYFCKSVLSSPFTVYSAKKFPGMDPSTSLSQTFAKQGLKVRMRSENRRKKANLAITNKNTKESPNSSSNNRSKLMPKYSHDDSGHSGSYSKSSSSGDVSPVFPSKAANLASTTDGDPSSNKFTPLNSFSSSYVYPNQPYVREPPPGLPAHLPGQVSYPPGGMVVPRFHRETHPGDAHVSKRIRSENGPALPSLLRLGEGMGPSGNGGYNLAAAGASQSVSPHAMTRALPLPQSHSQASGGAPESIMSIDRLLHRGAPDNVKLPPLKQRHSADSPRPPFIKVEGSGSSSYAGTSSPPPLDYPSLRTPASATNAFLPPIHDYRQSGREEGHRTPGPEGGDSSSSLPLTRCVSNPRPTSIPSTSYGAMGGNGHSSSPVIPPPSVSSIPTQRSQSAYQVPRRSNGYTLEGPATPPTHHHRPLAQLSHRSTGDIRGRVDGSISWRGEAPNSSGYSPSGISYSHPPTATASPTLGGGPSAAENTRWSPHYYPVATDDRASASSQASSAVGDAYLAPHSAYSTHPRSHDSYRERRTSGPERSPHQHSSPNGGSNLIPLAPPNGPSSSGHRESAYHFHFRNPQGMVQGVGSNSTGPPPPPSVSSSTSSALARPPYNNTMNGRYKSEPHLGNVPPPQYQQPPPSSSPYMRYSRGYHTQPCPAAATSGDASSFYGSPKAAPPVITAHYGEPDYYRSARAYSPPPPPQPSRRY
ncbi:hypothetical protein H4R33_005396 [Dimargaris cristalligena]|nr:hypothetical protein H4R33_005396 [Dimargaris cristalligena]